ncbi:NfeD family protein [Acuticoccus sp. MNP-M23]|uniref:NfeD family protein n=1 Tax=Acuticoccus sp. MNP-M23 TaxID=3072793 RepID=UPI00281560DA|nr:NfeD family protein [Acuticoccus sp. MNP-M23]WMS41174.1 NfeD family protein [Acuticoccus sp. MNP-M23]
MIVFLAILRDLGPYVWFIVGALFLIAEVMLPGVNLIWFGVAASATGLVDLAVPLGWELQMVCFLAISAISVVAARMITMRSISTGTEEVNRGPSSMIGRELALADPIVNGTGRALFADSTWRVAGADQPAGTRVRVVGIDASTLVVEPVER